MNKKAEDINQQVVVSILIIILSVLLLLFASRSCALIQEKHRQVTRISRVKC